MEDLLVRIFRKKQFYSDFLLTLREGEIKIFGREDKKIQDERIKLPSSVSSFQHFQILRQGGKYWIEDCRSKNGTFINEIRIQNRQELKFSIDSTWKIHPGIDSKAIVEIIPINPDLFSLAENDKQKESYITNTTKGNTDTNQKMDTIISLPLLGNQLRTRNPKMKDIYIRIKNVANTRYPILLLGERGTGKGSLAEAIHKLSGREKYEYCNAISLRDNFGLDTLVGHTRGSFTGATDNRDGILKKIDRGTLFLDEVNSMEVSKQVLFLSLFNFSKDENKVNFKPIGSDSEITVSIRLITAAININTEFFYPELFDRIGRIIIRIPPLRERIEDDLDLLLEDIIKPEKFNQKKITPEARKVLLSYEYPGNVRDFRNIIIRAFGYDKSSPKLEAKDIIRAINEGLICSNNLIADETGIISENTIRKMERDRIIECAKVGMSKTKAAKFLYGDKGSNTTKKLNRRLKEYGLEDLWEKK